MIYVFVQIGSKGERGRWAKGVWAIEGRGMRRKIPGKEKEVTACIICSPLKKKF